MNTFPSDPNWPTVTVVTRPGDLEPRWWDDAAVVGSAVFAAMRPDRLVPAWIGLLFLQLLGFIGHAAGIGSRMLPGNPVEAWDRWRAGSPLLMKAGASDPLGGLIHGGLLAAGGIAVILLWAMLVRLDAERLGRDRDVTLLAGIRWALGSWRRLVGAVLLPPVLALVLAVPAIVLGLLARVPVLDVIVGVLWIVPLVPAFAGGLITVAWLVSLPLIVASAACDGGDPVETTVRVASLLRRRFPRAIGMLGVAVVSGIAGWLLVAGVAWFTIGLASAGLDETARSLAWPSLMPVDGSMATDGARVAVRIVDFWHGVIVSLVHAWTLGFVLLAAGRILLVVRRLADRLPFGDLGDPAPE